MSTVPTKLKRDELLRKWQQRRRERRDVWIGAVFILPLLFAFPGMLFLGPVLNPPKPLPQYVAKQWTEEDKARYAEARRLRAEERAMIKECAADNDTIAAVAECLGLVSDED
jgi:hypothetical protein